MLYLQGSDVLACLCMWLVIVGSTADPSSPLHSFRTAAKWDVEALKQITQTLLDTNAVDILGSGLKVFMPVSWSHLSVFVHLCMKG